MPVLNRQYTFGTTATTNLTGAPGSNGGTGPSVLTVDHITGSVKCSAVNSTTNSVNIVLQNSDTTNFFNQSIPVTNVTNQPVAFNIVFPEGTGPSTADAAPVLLVVAGIAGVTVGTVSASCGFHYGL